MNTINVLHKKATEVTKQLITFMVIQRSFEDLLRKGAQYRDDKTQKNFGVLIVESPWNVAILLNFPQTRRESDFNMTISFRAELSTKIHDDLISSTSVLIMPK